MLHAPTIGATVLTICGGGSLQGVQLQTLQGLGDGVGADRVGRSDRSANPLQATLRVYDKVQAAEEHECAHDPSSLTWRGLPSAAY